MPRKKQSIDSDFKLDVVSVRLVQDVPLLSDHRICSPEDAIDVIGKYLCEMDREVVCVVNLKGDNTPINCHIASIGAINQAVAHPRELLKSTILSNAASMIIVHCHPSFNLTPSKEDTMLTDRMLKLSELIGIPLLDHVIVGGDNSQYFSFKAKGVLKNQTVTLQTNYETLDFSQTAIVAEKGRGR
ncbi:MAG: JAB domain-containing protein [Lachnospiraceae bacterium]|nr:JAB domain-containing protein [Lachnospiraceae bacterium]